MTWIKAAGLTELQDDGVLGVTVDGKDVALYRLGDEYFATDNICTHAFAYLSDGWVEDGKIECPLHQGQFDIRTGKALCAPLTKGIATFPVKVEGDDLMIDLSNR